MPESHVMMSCTQTSSSTGIQSHVTHVVRSVLYRNEELRGVLFCQAETKAELITEPLYLATTLIKHGIFL